MKVSASGGQAVELTKSDRNAGEISHRWPHALPDGRALLFSVWTGPGFDEHRIERLSIATGERDVLMRGADGVLAATNGYLIYGGRNDGLLAVPPLPAGRLAVLSRSQPDKSVPAKASAKTTGRIRFMGCHSFRTADRATNRPVQLRA